MPQGWARGQKLGHLKILVEGGGGGGSFIESFIFEHSSTIQGWLSPLTSDLRPHNRDPGWD